MIVHNTASRRRPARRWGRSALAIGVAGAALLATASPASAARTSKHVMPATATLPARIEFRSPTLTGARRDNVRGEVNMLVDANGNQRLSGEVRNNLTAWRNVTFRCTIVYIKNNRTYQLPTIATPSYRIGGKSRKNFDSPRGYQPTLKDDWNSIYANGYADCAMSVG
jgi:hypothetical protein